MSEPAPSSRCTYRSWPASPPCSVHAGDGAARIIIFILVVVCNDTGGYIAGVLFGKHPMAPTVSPKKSWEGLAGSLIGRRHRRRP